MTERKTYIILIDAMRADYFGAIGHQGCLTPTLVSLANHGTRFTNCKVPIPAVTAANHTSIMTSTYQGTHGVYGMAVHYKGLDFSHPRFSRFHGTPQMDYYRHHHLEGLPTFLNVVKINNSSAKTAIVTGKHWVGEILVDEDCDILIYAGNPSNPEYCTPSEGFIRGGERHKGDSPFPPRIYTPKKGDRFASPPKGTIKVPFKEMNADLIPSDKWVIDQAIQTICHDDPDYMYILLGSMDIAGHNYGSFSDNDVSNLNKLINPDAVKDQLYITDGEIKRFIDFLKRRHTFNKSRIIIAADHGMSSMKDRKSAVDIRKVLSNHGIKIRANTRWLPFGYNDEGQYEWCVSEGTHIYIFCREDEADEITKVIKQHLPHLYEVIDKKEQIERRMWKGSYEDVIWPQVVVILEPNYMNIAYGDEISALVSVGTQLKPHVQSLIAKAYGLPSAPGAHGTISEQNVPLIFVSPDESKVPVGVTIDAEVSILDIIPTINHLNDWPDRPSFEGKSLLPYKKMEKKCAKT